MILEIIDDKNNYKQKQFQINSNGLKNIDNKNENIQKKNDGKVLVSFEKENADIFIPFLNENEKTCFTIEYKKESDSFFLTSPRLASGTFIKIDQPLRITNNNIFAIGESNFIIDCTIPDQISLQFLEGPKSGQKFTFIKNLTPIQIGTKEDCNIRIDDPEISKYQCKYYD